MRKANRSRKTGDAEGDGDGRAPCVEPATQCLERLTTSGGTGPRAERPKIAMGWPRGPI